ncbi:hypothetical protein [Mesorhizobium sp. B2-1-8]|uniref:hypothetical protein n=1 Tax=Mesorhizobium sp. B2-1-8 TaxID=2589967 RepID=UPI002AB26F26|nr:hypothetical protein [Mesorhizobium sp. B2-1-8]
MPELRSGRDVDLRLARPLGRQFQNPDFPRLFERYAHDCATRFPWIQLYAPVNEMFICATFSARWGWWNEQLSTDTAFVTALKHIVKANVVAMRAILQARPDAIFIQSESSEYFHADSPEAIGKADRLNSQRLLSLDLNCRHWRRCAHLLLPALLHVDRMGRL